MIKEIVRSGKELHHGPFLRTPPPTGEEEIFEGTLKAGVIEIRLVSLFKQRNGSYLGTMDSPNQGAKDIPLDSVRLELTSATMAFEGKRSRDGNEIAGDLTQVGRTCLLVETVWTPCLEF